MASDAARFWQYETPLRCPRGKPMGWLGSLFWICSCRGCKAAKEQLWVQRQWKAKPRIRLHADQTLDFIDIEVADAD